MVDTEKVNESKKRGHRKKKFGDQESKVISFRIAKDTYDKNKEEIREKVNNLIELEVKKRKTSKAKLSRGLEGYYSEKKDIIRKIQPFQENKNNSLVEKKIIVNKDIIRKIQPTQVNKNNIPKEEININNHIEKETSNTIKPREEKPNSKIAYNFYEKYIDEVKEKVSEIITREKEESKESSIVEKQDKTINKKKIFDEFKEFIDKDNEEFKEFINENKD